jgi:hypothetical protein
MTSALFTPSAETPTRGIFNLQGSRKYHAQPIDRQGRRKQRKSHHLGSYRCHAGPDDAREHTKEGVLWEMQVSIWQSWGINMRGGGFGSSRSAGDGGLAA